MIVHRQVSNIGVFFFFFVYCNRPLGNGHVPQKTVQFNLKKKKLHTNVIYDENVSTKSNTISPSTAERKFKSIRPHTFYDTRSPPHRTFPFRKISIEIAFLIVTNETFWAVFDQKKKNNNKDHLNNIYAQYKRGVVFDRYGGEK